MGKSKPTPKARKDDNPFKIKGGARKLRLNKKVSICSVRCTSRNVVVSAQAADSFHTRVHVRTYLWGRYLDEGDTR